MRCVYDVVTEVVRCEVQIHNIGLRSWDGRHDWLYSIFEKPVLKDHICKVSQWMGQSMSSLCLRPSLPPLRHAS